MRNNHYAGVAALAALLLGAACAKYEGDTAATPSGGAPADVARADSGQTDNLPTPDSAGQVAMDSTAGRDSAAAMKPPAPASLALEASADGQSIFRHDTFGNEVFWTETLKMNEVIQSKLDPNSAMKMGLKVDAEALPAGALEGADMGNAATTLILLKANAIVGIKAMVDDNNQVTRVGITCALCHSTVDNSVQEGVGRRMDGWPNRQLNVGALLAMSPAITDEQRDVLNSWGEGKADPYFTLTGQGANQGDPASADPKPQTDSLHQQGENRDTTSRDTTNQTPSTQQVPSNQQMPDNQAASQSNQADNKNSSKLAVVIPPAYGLAKIENVTYTAEGSISYWNSFAAVNVMHGIGQVADRDGNSAQGAQNEAQPMPAERGDTMPQSTDSTAMPKDTSAQSSMPAPTGNPTAENQNQQSQSQDQDLITPKLPALRDYQHSLEAPAAPEGHFDQASATRGERVFRRACISCHVGVTGTDNNSTQAPSEVTPGGDIRNARLKGKVHAANETGMDPQYAERSENKGYRTTPLRGLWQHAPYFHDGSAADLLAVVNHYDRVFKLNLTAEEKADLVEYLKSL